MNANLKLTIAVAGMMAIISSCNKAQDTPAPAQVQITAQQNGQPVALVKGQTLEVTLQNPGDGLYSFDQPIYGSAVLRFVEHLHQGPTNNNIGNFGTDTWDFTAVKAGTTTLTITATRENDKSTTVAMLTNNIAVK